jgi:hypothetical protein
MFTPNRYRSEPYKLFEIQQSNSLQAQQELDRLIRGHQQSRYRQCTDGQFAAHATDAANRLHTVFDGDPDSARRQLLVLATEIENLEDSDPWRDGHHIRAANLLRAQAKGMLISPWAGHEIELQGDGQVLYALATALWRCNPSGQESWNAPFYPVFLEVWNRDDPNIAKKVRPAASKLSKWMLEHAIDLKVSVRKPRQRFECGPRK